MDKIELQAKTDHELLVMSVMQGNQIVDHLDAIDGTLCDHEDRIRCLEGLGCATPGLTVRQKAGLWTGLVAFVSAIVAAVAEYFSKR